MNDVSCLSQSLTSCGNDLIPVLDSQIREIVHFPGNGWVLIISFYGESHLFVIPRIP